MEHRIFDADGTYVLAPGTSRQGAVVVGESQAVSLIRRWIREEPHRTQLRRLAADALHLAACGGVSDEDLLRMLLARLELGGALCLFRESGLTTRARYGYSIGGAGEDSSEEGEPPPSDEPRIRPCDFETIVIKCKHMPGDDRTMTDARFWRDGGMDRDNLPAPRGGRAYTKVIEVVGRHDDAHADDVTISLEGGPGYTCAGGDHPKITIVDSNRERQVHEGQTSVTLKAKCRELPPPPDALANPFRLIHYYFFPDQQLNLYRIDVQSCGRLDDGSYGFGRSQQQVRVYPSDTYKMSLSIPALGKMSHERGRSRHDDGTEVASRSTTTSNAVTGQSETTGHSESTSDSQLQSTDTYSYSDRTGGLKETSSTTLTADNELTESRRLEDADPVSNPAREAAASFAIERNGEDVKSAASIGQLINALVNIQNDVQSVMNFIRDFQPQVGWKFVFEMELFKGELSYEWGYKEWEDHTVYDWWKFDIGMTLFSLMLELRFGADLRVCGVGITVLVFGNTSIDAKVNASKEASPADSKPWELAVSSQPKGELGIRSALGADWVKAEGKLTCGFPFEAKCKCSTRDPFHIDWKLEFTGVKAVVVGSAKLVGSIEKEWTVVEPRKNWKTGRFPAGDETQRPLRGRRGAIAA